MSYALLAAAVTSFLLGLALVLTVRRIARRIGFTDKPGGRKQHDAPVALGGGIAIGLATSLPLLAVAWLVWRCGDAQWLERVPAQYQPTVKGAGERLYVLLGVLAGGASVFALGLWDDLQPFRPSIKLLGQFIIAITLTTLVPDLRVTLFVDQPWLHVALTSVWLVLVMNAFNLIDNMDGQTGVVSLLSGGALLLLAIQTGQFFVAGLLVALLGAVAAFLVFNLPPASIFMGDAGSLFIGYMLAAATTLCTFTGEMSDNPLFAPLLPLMIFAVPIYDSLSVIVIRMRQGKPLLAGDRNHFSHRLMRLGMTDSQVLATVAMLVVATALGATIPYGSTWWKAVGPAAQTVAVLLVIVQLERMHPRGGEEERGTQDET
jgi:UDP-GlcNAc:undecaprenyl-phosphate/decaprenyl-phosphate GlcNAc-1-phosphate transferase